MGVPVDDLQAFLDAEHEIARSQDLTDFLQKHLPGVRSLTTDAAEAFWRDHEGELPRDVLYTSFRGAIDDPSRDLPRSNEIFFQILKRSSARSANDMQVRLENQSMRGELAEHEVLMPVAEANHWQWEINPRAVSESMMPAEMAERAPQRELFVAYFQALREVGLVLGDVGEPK
jgi:hypothetical protein